jgi:hypothetical protein
LYASDVAGLRGRRDRGAGFPGDVEGTGLVLPANQRGRRADRCKQHEPPDILL